MIRKIILLISVSVLVVWFSGAHIIKNKLISIVNSLNSDNIKLSFQNTKISGFPFNWQIVFTDPKMVVIEHKSLTEISMPELRIECNYLVQNINMSFGKLVNFRTDKEGALEEYSLVSKGNMEMGLAFHRPAYFIESSSMWYDFIEDVSFDLEQIRAEFEKSEIFSMSDVQLNYSNKQNDSVDSRSFTLQGSYDSRSKGFEINKAELLVDLSCLSNNSAPVSEEKLDFEHKLELLKFHLAMDDSSCDIKGEASLNSNSSPKGEFDISMKKYSDMANVIRSKDFRVLSSSINKILKKAELYNISDDSDEVDLKVVFSDQGISIAK